MKRFHVHVTVADLATNIRFYSTAFGMPPTVVKPDYAKWMLQDPCVNFAISTQGRTLGVDHLGLQVDTEEELDALRDQVARAEIAAIDQPGAECCYARTDKYWTTDPQGIAWETFRTLGTVPVYGGTRQTRHENVAACCTPTAATATSQPSNTKACCS